jgi:hypothetical protein
MVRHAIEMMIGCIVVLAFAYAVYNPIPPRYILTHVLHSICP